MSQPTQLDDILEDFRLKVIEVHLVRGHKATLKVIKDAETEAKQALADYIQREVVAARKDELDLYGYSPQGLSFPKYAEKRYKELEALLSTIKVPLVVGGALPHTRRKEKT